jgi:hypothetical protein
VPEKMTVSDDREAAGGRRIDARFVWDDAGVSIGRRALSRVVQGSSDRRKPMTPGCRDSGSEPS